MVISLFVVHQLLSQSCYPVAYPPECEKRQNFGRRNEAIVPEVLCQKTETD